MNPHTEMNTLKDLVASGREREGVAIDALDRTTPYSYREFATNVWKAGNLLGHYGARGGTVAVAVGPKAAEMDGAERFGTVDAAEPLLAILGGTLLGVPVTVLDDGGAENADAPSDSVKSVLPDETRVLVVPWGWVERYDPPPACSVIAYGGPPTAPSVAHFEAEMWSETPVEPPERVEMADDALRIDGESYTHGGLVAAIEAVVEALALDESSTVGLAVPVTSPGSFVAGVLAPLSVGATIELGGDPEQFTGREDVPVILTEEGDRGDDGDGDEARVPVSGMTERVHSADSTTQ